MSFFHFFVVFEDAFSSCTAEPTPTPPSTPQDCQMCIMSNNSVAPEVKPNPQKKIKRKWNCCISIPDSPNDPQSPSEPRCLVSLCKHKFKSKSLPALEGRPLRTHGRWSGSKLRIIFRVFGKIYLPDRFIVSISYFFHRSSLTLI